MLARFLSQSIKWRLSEKSQWAAEGQSINLKTGLCWYISLGFCLHIEPDWTCEMQSSRAQIKDAKKNIIHWNGLRRYDLQ